MIRKVELGFFFLLVAAATVVSFFIIKPYIGALFVAVVFAIVFHPVYKAIHGKIRKESLASLITLVLLSFVLLIPASLFGFFLSDDARRLYESAESGISVIQNLDASLVPIETYARTIIPAFEINVAEYANAALSFFVSHFGNVFARAVGFIFQTFIMLFALFFLFRDGEKFRSYIVTLSPLTNEYDERILKRVETAISSVVKGKLLIVFIQGILASIGFFILGVPSPVLWGALTSLAALIPAVGVALVFIPLAIYLLVTGGVGVSFALILFGVVVGAIDNLLGPVLYEKGLLMHPLFILLSVLGGIALFGPIGFLAGPVVLSLLLALLDIYPLLFQSSGNHQ